MRKLMQQLGNQLVTRSMRNERSFVNEPTRGRHLMARDLLLFVIVIAATIIDDQLAQGSWLDTLALLIVAVYVGYGSFQTTRRMSSYRSGWLDGRHIMVSSLAEAQRRGMHPHEWIEAELARDLAIMGITQQRDEPAAPPDGSHDDL